MVAYSIDLRQRGPGGGGRGRRDPGADRRAVPRLGPVDPQADRPEGPDRRDRPQAQRRGPQAPDPGRGGPGAPGRHRQGPRCHPAGAARGDRLRGLPGDRLAGHQAAEHHAKKKSLRAAGATRPGGPRAAAGVGRVDGRGRPGPVRLPRREPRQDDHDQDGTAGPRGASGSSTTSRRGSTTRRRCWGRCGSTGRSRRWSTRGGPTWP